MNKEIKTNSKYNSTHKSRFVKTLSFCESILKENDRVLDLGPINPMSKLLSEKVSKVDNSDIGLDLDLDYDIVKKPDYDIVTAFEILEHLVSPFPLLKNIKASKLIISVPLKLWFTTAYWNEKDPYDRHYHEFEPRQLEMLLDKAGWKIVKQEKWASPIFKLGIRPILRLFYPRYYIVYCVRT
ncbi:MAG: methyltransferase domain-containing protein [Flavobacteriaceae bacterium]|nr:methyltransferase domain-containing protein [Flavobacteriaceae bacterium]